MHKFYKLAVIFFIGLLTIIFVFLRTRLNNLSQDVYQVKSSNYALHFYRHDLSQEVFKISPFDDYYYLSGIKKHFADRDTFIRSHELSNKFTALFHRLLFNEKQLSWVSENKDGMKISYSVVSNKGNEIRVKRSVSELVEGVDNIGESIVICNDCFITDSDNRAFLNENILTKEKLDRIYSFNLMPVLVVDEMLPVGIKELRVYDKNYNLKLRLIVNNQQEVFYDEMWQLVELKTPISFGGFIPDQIIYINK